VPDTSRSVPHFPPLSIDVGKGFLLLVCSDGDIKKYFSQKLP